MLAVFTRQVIGWSMQPQLDREVVLQAVLMAVWQRPTSDAVILHFDRGTQYTAHEFKEYLKAHGIVSSMRGVGHWKTCARGERLRAAETGTGPSASLSDSGRSANRYLK